MGEQCLYECELCFREYADEDFLLSPYVCPKCENETDRDPLLYVNPYDL